MQDWVFRLGMIGDVWATTGKGMGNIFAPALAQVFCSNYASYFQIKGILCEFSTVWADWADLGRTETDEQMLKYSTFKGGFFNFSGGKSFCFLKYCIVPTKKLNCIKAK